MPENIAGIWQCYHIASDWWNQISHAVQPIRSTTQIWVVTRHQYGISALLSQTSFGEETSGSVAKCRLFSQATTTKIIKHKDSVYIEEGKGSLNSSGIPSRLSGPITLCRHLLQTCLAPQEWKLGI